MSGPGGWLTAALARTLRSDEREAVFGDLAELGLTRGQGTKSVAGLVLRRQLRLWMQPGPWAAMLLVTVPMCPLLVTLAGRFALGLVPHLDMRMHLGIAYGTGLSNAALLAVITSFAVALVTWAWSCGDTVALLSGRAAWLNGVVFLVIAVVLVVSPMRSASALPVGLYSWLDLVTQALLVGLPVCLGLRHGSRSAAFAPVPGPRRLVTRTLLPVVTGIIALWTQGWYGMALENWRDGAPTLTFWQALGKAGGSAILRAGWPLLLVLTLPAVSTLAVLGHRRGGRASFAR